MLSSKSDGVFFNETATTEIYTLSLHDALPIFRKRLSALGHAHEQIARITCPIGDPALGKQPHMIAIGVAHQLLMRRNQAQTRAEVRA